MEIIVDIGINHDGSIHIAKELIRQAAFCGVDIIKFQSYNVDSIFGENGTDPNPEIYKMVKPLELTKEQLYNLKMYCESYNKEFMCSVFDEERLNWMEMFGVKRHKVASRVSKLDRGLAYKILNTSKETFVSLGFNAKRFESKYDKQIKYLYCKSVYPAYSLDLADMPEKFNKFYGASLHYLGPSAALLAVSRGAKAIEMHFTLNKSNTRHPDHVCSLDPIELKEMVKYAREIENILSDINNY